MNGMKTKNWFERSLLLCVSSLAVFALYAADNFVNFEKGAGGFPLIVNSTPCMLMADEQEDQGVKIALDNLQADIARVCREKPRLSYSLEKASHAVLVGTLNSPLLKSLFKTGKLDEKELLDKREKYIIRVIDDPMEGIQQALVIAGSDRRGTIYGIYELSKQIGVSPWYWWADVPVVEQTDVHILPGTYTDGEPAVTYRGIFLNDEAPCLTSWVKNSYNTDYGDHRFYAQVFELILRLKGNFLWPAMWNWAFYADDDLNSRTAQEMGIIIGTSHHEPMARNHQEWVRKRGESGPWDYTTNQEQIDSFFREGIERMKGSEDLVTIGMRGDGDAPMSEEADVKLLERIVKNQRKIITQVTKRPAKETPQVWALYKEVLAYYDKGMRVPDDVIMLLCDDNWGNVRRLPNPAERNHPGGWGMYYHVDYVGAPRNSKWLNVTPIQNMWEQLSLTYQYGVDKLWVLNVGDLKPMEYPITLFLDLAWNPEAYTAANLLDHPRLFCAQQFGAEQADEAARILNLYSKYNGRITAELLDKETYNLETGEWKQVVDEYAKLEAEALRQYISLKPEWRDAYKQLILFPVQAMSNLYEMYYAQAMNHKLYAQGNPEANFWADKVEHSFERDKALHEDYNRVMSGGKWNGMMTQKHIGYVDWNDDFPADKLPEVFRIEAPEKAVGGYIYSADNGYVAIEAAHYFSQTPTEHTQWTLLPYMGRTLSGVALMPYTESVEGASLAYRIALPEKVDKVTLHVVVKSTLAFQNLEGHRYAVGFEGGTEQVINFNNDLNEQPENIYTTFYPTVARRIVEKQISLDLPNTREGLCTLTFRPLDPGIVLEKMVIDWGGYKPSYLFMNESPCSRTLSN